MHCNWHNLASILSSSIYILPEHFLIILTPVIFTAREQYISAKPWPNYLIGTLQVFAHSWCERHVGNRKWEFITHFKSIAHSTYIFTFLPARNPRGVPIQFEAAKSSQIGISLYCARNNARKAPAPPNCALAIIHRGGELPGMRERERCRVAIMHRELSIKWPPRGPKQKRLIQNATPLCASDNERRIWLKRVICIRPGRDAAKFNGPWLLD